MLIDLIKVIDDYDFNVKNILHLGANEGQERTVYEALDTTVIWVEAIPEVFGKLEHNLAPYTNQFAVNACIGNEDDKEVIFHISNNEAQSSSYLELGTHKNVHPEVHYVEHLSMRTIRLDTLIKSLNINIDETWMLCADLQGSEMDALIGCGEILSRFGFVYLEVNEQQLYEGCALKRDIERYLEQYDFIPIESFIYKQFGWGDEFFVKQSLLNNN